MHLLDVLFHQREIGFSDDSKKDVPELMAHAARDLPDADEARGFDELLLHPLKHPFTIPGANHLTGLLDDLALGEGLVEVIPVILELLAEELMDVLHASIVVRRDDHATQIFVERLDRKNAICWCNLISS